MVLKLERHAAWEGLIIVGSNQLTVADIVGPGGARVCLAGKGVAFGASINSPLTIEAIRRKRTEKPSIFTLGLNKHQVFVLSLDGINLNGLEEVIFGILEDNLGTRPEATGEIVDRHARTVDSTIIATEEQIHILAIADNGLIDRTVWCVGNLAGEKSLRFRPAVDVGWVVRSPV
ncbi:hypothetical protein HG530_013106 [Fusarium avenaceum]|nr:hypothetical protein HG530_013106 [Fusarium avenaceum]